MATTTFGSGQGASLTAKAQSSWGGTFMSTGQRTLPFKTAKLTLDPHMVQGGPYLANQLADLASARALVWTDAKVTLTGDVFNTGFALLLASALGCSATLTELGTTTAYALGGASGATASAPDLNDTYVDFQFGLPTTDGAVHPFSLHSGVIQKAEFVFDRGQLVTYSFDFIFQQVETSTSLLTATEPTNEQVFSMATTNTTLSSAIPANSSGFAAGAYGSEVVIDGIKKATFTLDRKLAAEADRMYLGLSLQQSPVTVDYVDMSVSLEADYTALAKTTLFDLLLANTSVSLIAQVAGSEIGSTSYYNTFALNVPAWYLDNPDAAPSPDGPKIIGSTLTGKARIDASGDPWLHATLVTGDTTY